MTAPESVPSPPLVRAAIALVLATAVLIVAVAWQFADWQRAVADVESLRSSDRSAPGAIASARNETDRRRTVLVAASVLLVVAIAATIGALASIAIREQRARVAIEAARARESQHDPRTGLPNRHAFTEWLVHAIAACRRDGGGLGLVAIAFDPRAIPVPPEIAAREIVRRLQEVKRESDYLGMLDNDVFALAALQASDPRDLARLAERLLAAFSEPLASGPLVAPRLGVASFPRDADDLPGLVAAADAALLNSRRSGGQVHFHRVSSPRGLPFSG